MIVWQWLGPFAPGAALIVIGVTLILAARIGRKRRRVDQIAEQLGQRRRPRTLADWIENGEYSCACRQPVHARGIARCVHSERTR